MIKSTEDIVLYKNENGNIHIEVNLKEHNIWLSQKQMAELFNKNVKTINEHIRNIFKEGELTEKSVIRKFRITANDGKIYDTLCYNLDLIISVGYRVNSKRGTQFRIWATNILKQHLINGFTIYEKRLKEQTQKMAELKKTVEILQRTSENQEIQIDEAKGLLKVIADYTFALNLLDDYDHQKVEMKELTNKEAYLLTYEEAIRIIEIMKNEFSSDLFGKERDESFKSSLGAIYQSAFGEDVYSSIEEKAANLLYFIVKNHSFTDGNKRIAAALFIYFMKKNNILYHENRKKRISDNTLVAITLMIAESKSNEKDIIIKVVVNLMNSYHL